MSIPHNLKPLIVILGPTASGKSEMAVLLAKRFNGEVVSADSRQIYRGMDIGTAKVVAAKQTRNKNAKQTQNITHSVPHYMIDIVEPDEEFTLARYKRMAVEIIRDIQSRGKVPFLVGGTGLYTQALVDNLKIPKVAPDKKLRRGLEKLSLQELLEKLEKLDPIGAINIDPKNKRRLIRAIEVCLATGRPFSKQQIKGKSLFNVLQIGIKISRQKLFKRINKRVDKMFKIGLIEEVKSLAKRYSWNLPSMSGIGYKEIGQYLRGKFALDEAKEIIKKNTRCYARRQMTWFRRDKRICWVKNYKEAEALIGQFLS